MGFEFNSDILSVDSLPAGLRLGMYNPIKSAIGAEGANTSLFTKIMAGCTSGMVAAAISNPTDLIKVSLHSFPALRVKNGLDSFSEIRDWIVTQRSVSIVLWIVVCDELVFVSYEKTRLQSKDGKGKTVVDVVKRVVREEGATGLWHGVMPSMARAAVLTAAQCASYDEIKRGLMHYGGLGDSFTTHLTSSMITGLVSTTVTTPIDVVKTQIMVRGGQFRMEYLYAEGISGLMKGWGASYMRLGPQTTIIFLTLEILRSYMGLGSL